MSTEIYTITHKPFTPPNDPMYIPLHVGRAKSVDLGFLGDDTGESISAENPYFCELTGMYWIWKNRCSADYIGICHYRRYLINEKGRLFTQAELQDILSRYDIVTTKLLTLTCSYEQGFSENHHGKDLKTTAEVIQEKYPEYYETYQKLVTGPHTYFGNIFITSRELYSQYCQWLFDILFEVKKRTDFTGYNSYQKRLFGFISEFLQTVWIQKNGWKTRECMVGMSGEKIETRQLKEKLGEFFATRDYEGAKQYFLDCYSKRPDVLMEASDITGELRLCMQIISTCSFEDEAKGTCILDYIKDYHGLISHFHNLNQAVAHEMAGKASPGEKLFLSHRNLASPQAVQIAKMLLAQKGQEISVK